MPSENQQVLRLRLAYLMRRFLLLALGMGFLLPTSANALSFHQKKEICADYEGGNISIEKAAKKLGVKKAFGGWVKNYCAYYKN